MPANPCPEPPSQHCQVLTPSHRPYRKSCSASELISASVAPSAWHAAWASAQFFVSVDAKYQWPSKNVQPPTTSLLEGGVCITPPRITWRCRGSLVAERDSSRAASQTPTKVYEAAFGATKKPSKEPAPGRYAGTAPMSCVLITSTAVQLPVQLPPAVVFEE